MKFISWHVKRLFFQHHFLGVLSALIIVLLGLFHSFVLVPANAKLIASQAGLHGIQIRAIQLHSESEKNKDPLIQLSQFYAAFPVKSDQTLSEVLDKFYRVAAEHNIAVEKANYQLATDPESQLERYNITLPVKGSYPQLRRFITQIMRGLPCLSLDSVSFSRLSKEDSVIETQLQFSLYFKQKK